MKGGSKMESQSLNNPLSLFSSDKQKEINSDFSLEKFSKGVVLFEQEITKVEKFYILSKGLAKFYYGQNNRQILTGEVKPGDNFGGISILLNDAVSIRSLIALEDCLFTTIAADSFLKLCQENQEFKNYFTNEFGKCMLNKSFAGIISRQIKDKEFSLPFFNRPIHTIFRPSILSCTIDTTIEDAAFKMSKNSASSIFIK